LDLPNPWLAVPYAAYVIKPACRIATYSPCVEQSQRTILALEKAGFHSITTQEFRRREYYVDEIDIEGPPTEKRPRSETHNIAAYSTGNNNSNGNSTISYGDVDTGAEADNEESQASECEVSLATEDTAHGSEEAMMMMMMTAQGTIDGGPMDATVPMALPTTATTNSTTTATAITAPASPQKTLQQQQPQQPPRKRVLVARPFVSMRGHTAFLTFATAGNKIQPYPSNNNSNGQQRTKSVPIDATPSLTVDEANLNSES
jgi:tRNA (adenine57-N1/adenine58-N1)-methyltransferase